MYMTEYANYFHHQAAVPNIFKCFVIANASRRPLVQGLILLPKNANENKKCSTCRHISYINVTSHLIILSFNMLGKQSAELANQRESLRFN